MYRYFLQNKQPVPYLEKRKDFVGPIKRVKMEGVYSEDIPAGLPSRLVDPELMGAGKPTFLRIGEGNEPRNELLRVVKQYPSQDEVRTKVAKEALSLDYADKYNLLRDVNKRYALIKASQETGIPLEPMGLSVDPESSAWKIQGAFNATPENVNNARTLLGRVASQGKARGDTFLYDALGKMQGYYSLPRETREIATQGHEGIDSIYSAYLKAEPPVTATSQGNRPILPQAGGLNPNIGIPSGSPENIPPMDIEGMRGANRFVDVSQGAQTARVIQYPGTSERLGLLAQQKGLRLQGEGITSLEDLIRADKARGIGVNPVVTPTVPYAADIPTGQEFILSPKVSIETKRPRFIDTGAGIYTRSGERITPEQKDLLDTGMADLEDRSFTLRDPATAKLEQLNRPRRAATVEGAMGTDSIWQNNNAQYRPSSRLGMQVLGAEMVGNTFLKGRDKLSTVLELSPVVEIKNLWGTDIPIEDPARKSVELVKAYVPGEKKYIESRLPINRLTNDLSDRVLSGEVDLRNYEPFKSKNTPQYYLDQSKDFVGPIRVAKDNTYGAREGETPWREYYSDPFMYEDKGQDKEVARLMNAVENAPRRLEEALSQQALANRRAFDIEQSIGYVPSLNRIAKGARKGSGDIAASPETIMDWVETRKAIKPIVAPLQEERRIAEINAAKATDTIAQLKAAQELLGVEYMVKPKSFSPEVLQGYRQASLNKGGVKNAVEIPVNSRFANEVDTELRESKLPLAQAPISTTPRIASSRDAVQMAREANFREEVRRLAMEDFYENTRDYDIASAFGFTGNY